MTAPDLTAYRAVHTALREATARMAAAASDLSAHDWRRIDAFGRYWRGYAGEVEAHHTIEDDIVFPALLARCPVFQAHLDRTAADHHHLDELMAATEAALAKVQRGLGRPAVIELADVLGQLALHMDTHLGFEDDDVLPLIERHFSAEEYKALDEEALKHLGLGKQAAFTVPFILSWQPPAIVAHLWAGAPGAFKVLWFLTRRRHARTAQAALGTLAPARPEPAPELQAA